MKTTSRVQGAAYMTTTTYLDRLLDPITTALTPEFARTLVDLRADDGLQAEIDVLRKKAERGTLTSEEANEYRDFIEAVDVLSILQSKARQFLSRQSA